jgi:hypothetical protein
MTHSRRLLSALCLVAACGSQAQSGTPFTDPLDGRFDMSEYLAENAFGFLPVPIIITEPAVDGGLGMSAVAAAYTGNESWFVGGGHVGFFRQGTIRYRLGGGYGDVDLDYYSIGNNDLKNPLSINTESLFLIQSLKFKLGELPLYLGPIQRYVNAELSPASDLGELLPPGTPPETVDGLTDLLTSDVALSALGLEIELDTRNNFFTPTAGYYMDFRYGAYRDAFGSDIDYDWYNLNSLNYFELTDHWRFALRLEAEVADSDEPLPPFATPSIELRGIPAARYQGDYVGVLEGELTWQPDLRWSALAFLGAGRATYDSSDFSSASSEVSRGVVHPGGIGLVERGRTFSSGYTLTGRR